MTSDSSLPTTPAADSGHAPASTRSELVAALADALSGRRLLEHPFYRRWEAGVLDREELAEYASHYRAFEAALPAVLEAVAEGLAAEGRPEAAAMVARNLSDEVGNPEPHLALFDRFAGAVRDGVPVSAPGPAAVALVETYRTLVDESPVAALAGLAAYETQAPAIASSKAEGLRRWYGVDDAGAEFWDVHAELDAEHGEWVLDALALTEADADHVRQAAGRAADAWWAFLDEREADAPELRSATA